MVVQTGGGGQVVDVGGQPVGEPIEDGGSEGVAFADHAVGGTAGPGRQQVVGGRGGHVAHSALGRWMPPAAALTPSARVGWMWMVWPIAA